MNKLILILVAITLNACSTIRPCTDVMKEFYSVASDHDMNMGNNVVEKDRQVYAAFNDDSVLLLCFTGSSLNEDDANKTCASGTHHAGVCRYKDGRYFGYSIGKVDSRYLLPGVR